MTTTNVIKLKNRLVELLDTRSVRRGDFTLSSGRKSHYYIDARRTTMAGEGLAIIGELGINAIRSLGWNVDAVGGMTLAADPIAYAIAVASRHSPPPLDAFTVRKEQKTHGTGRQIEGCFEKGMSVVIVEDTITTGGSAARAAEVVLAQGGTVSGVLVLVDREEGGVEALRAAGHAVHSLLSIKDLGL
ncbi:MAG: orotate phosphoribosyltransferase [Gemmatimonadetes bacterium]|nr:orotate phosphoribosyltransferase [Gemmatimonadota bacterium]